MTASLKPSWREPRRGDSRQWYVSGHAAPAQRTHGECARHPYGEIDVDDHHAHGSGRRRIARVIHVEDRHGRELEIGRVEKNNNGDRRHRVHKEIERDLHERGSGQRHGDGAENREDAAARTSMLPLRIPDRAI